MKSSLKIALALIVVSIGIHFYLSSHYYGVLYGASDSPSVCNINSKLNCDAVAASSYSSLYGIPLSTLGAFTNIALLLLLLFNAIGFTSDEEASLKYSYILGGFVAVTSLVMLGITLTQLTVYCLFCFILYALSIITFGLLHKAIDTKPSVSNLVSDVTQLFTQHRQVLAVLVLVPIAALFTHKSMLDNILGGQSKRFERMMKSSIANWENSAEMTFNIESAHTKGNQNASAPMQIVEFADFRCGHCKKASHSLSAFMSTNPDVQLTFYSFPLDGACNSAIKHSNGISCRLAKAAHCGGEQSLAWEVHDTIFENQADFQRATSSNDIDTKLKAKLKNFDVNWEKLTACMDSEKTHSLITKQAQLGVNSGVKGTPTIYVNGKKLPLGQNLKVLSQVREKILSK